jgi:hypothetical protein
MLEEDAMRTVVQPSLSISQPGDASEVEADRAADEIMRMPDLTVAGPQLSRMDDASVQRSCAACSATQSDLSAMVAQAVSGTGRALDEDTRGFMESRFGYDFNHVRGYILGARRRSLPARWRRRLTRLAATLCSPPVDMLRRPVPAADSSPTNSRTPSSKAATAARRARLGFHCKGGPCR